MKTTSLLGLILAGLTACGGERSASDDAAAPALPLEVHFTAKDFAFDGPDTIAAGMITFVLNDESPTWHHLQLIRLPEGMSLPDFQQGLSGMQPNTPPPSWLVEAGGVNPPPPGAPGRVTMLVEPGAYAVICVVDTPPYEPANGEYQKPDHVPHVFKGMIKGLTVTPSTTPPAPLPASDMSLTLVDYAFSFAEPPTSGSHVIRVENAGTQSHEIALFRLLPGKTVDDVGAWAATYEGAPPMTAVGGVPAMRPGQVADVSVTLAPGNYVGLCFVPDAKDGMPHLQHGMVLPFTVS
jgi:hypothetical protein